MASLFPTALAMRHAKKLGIQNMITHTHELSVAMQDFQRVSLVSDFDDAITILEAHIVKGELSEEQLDGLEKVYNFTEIEADGIVIDKVGGIIEDGVLEQNKISAAQVFNSIRNGDSQDSKGAIKKVIFELEE